MQNDWHQWLSGSFDMHRISFRRTPLGELTALPTLFSWFKGEGGEGKGKGREKGREREPSPLRKFLDPPLAA